MSKVSIPKKRTRNITKIQTSLTLTFKVINSLDLDFFIQAIEADAITKIVNDPTFLEQMRKAGRKWVHLAEVTLKFRDEFMEILNE